MNTSSDMSISIYILDIHYFQSFTAFHEISAEKFKKLKSPFPNYSKQDSNNGSFTCWLNNTHINRVLNIVFYHFQRVVRSHWASQSVSVWQTIARIANIQRIMNSLLKLILILFVLTESFSFANNQCLDSSAPTNWSQYPVHKSELFWANKWPILLPVNRQVTNRQLFCFCPN